MTQIDAHRHLLAGVVFMLVLLVFGAIDAFRSRGLWWHHVGGPKLLFTRTVSTAAALAVLPSAWYGTELIAKLVRAPSAVKLFVAEAAILVALRVLNRLLPAMTLRLVRPLLEYACANRVRLPAREPTIKESNEADQSTDLSVGFQLATDLGSPASIVCGLVPAIAWLLAILPAVIVGYQGRHRADLGAVAVFVGACLLMLGAVSEAFDLRCRRLRSIHHPEGQPWNRSRAWRDVPWKYRRAFGRKLEAAPMCVLPLPVLMLMCVPVGTGEFMFHATGGGPIGVGVSSALAVFGCIGFVVEQRRLLQCKWFLWFEKLCERPSRGLARTIKLGQRAHKWLCRALALAEFMAIVATSVALGSWHRGEAPMPAAMVIVVGIALLFVRSQQALLLDWLRPRDVVLLTSAEVLEAAEQTSIERRAAVMSKIGTVGSAIMGLVKHPGWVA